MNADRRDLINHLGAELAGIMEDASADAAMLRGVSADQLAMVISQLTVTTDRARVLTAAMEALAASG